MAPSIRVALTSTASVPSLTEISFQKDADLLVPVSVPEILFSTSPELVLENILPTGTPPTLTLHV